MPYSDIQTQHTVGPGPARGALGNDPPMAAPDCGTRRQSTACSMQRHLCAAGIVKLPSTLELYLNLATRLFQQRRQLRRHRGARAEPRHFQQQSVLEPLRQQLPMGITKDDDWWHLAAWHAVRQLRIPLGLS